jgi:hypothetical protein
MNDILRVTLKHLLFYSAFVAFVSTILAWVLPRTLITPALPFMIVFFILVTLGILFFLLKANEKGMTRFINAFMITTGLKLIVFILIIVAYSLANRYDAVPFLGSFFILYLLYTGFEVYAILGLIKAGKRTLNE